MHSLRSAQALARRCGNFAQRCPIAAAARCPVRQRVTAAAPAARITSSRPAPAAGRLAASRVAFNSWRRSMSGSAPDQAALGAAEPRQQSNAAGTANAAADDAVTQASAPEDVLLQYVVLRRDLWTEQGWPLGSVVAQVCTQSPPRPARDMLLVQSCN